MPWFCVLRAHPVLLLLLLLYSFSFLLMHQHPTCSAGFFCPPTTVMQRGVPCPAATFNPVTRASTERNCAGFFCETGSSVAIDCPSGTTTVEFGAQQASACEMCFVFLSLFSLFSLFSFFFSLFLLFSFSLFLFVLFFSLCSLCTMLSFSLFLALHRYHRTLIPVGSRCLGLLLLILALRRYQINNSWKKFHLLDYIHRGLKLLYSQRVHS
jgi:hypothetical protein